MAAPDKAPIKKIPAPPKRKISFFFDGFLGASSCGASSLALGRSTTGSLMFLHLSLLQERVQVVVSFLGEKKLQIPFQEPPVFSHLDRRDLAILRKLINRGDGNLQVIRNFFDV